MLKKIKFKIETKKEIISLILLVTITAFSTIYYNFTKNQINNQYKELLENVYFKFDNIRRQVYIINKLIKKDDSSNK